MNQNPHNLFDTARNRLHYYRSHSQLVSPIDTMYLSGCHFAAAALACSSLFFLVSAADDLYESQVGAAIGGIRGSKTKVSIHDRNLSAAYCTWTQCGNGSTGGAWCNQSQSRCEGPCGGMWCGGTPSPPTPAPPTPPPPTPAPPTPTPPTPTPPTPATIRAVLVPCRARLDGRLLQTEVQRH